MKSNFHFPVAVGPRVQVIMKRLTPALLVTFALFGCNGPIDAFVLDGGTTTVLVPPDAGATYVQQVPADVLFVVDNSGSMAVNQSRLALGFQSFLAQVEGQGDFRIGVVSTDMSSSDGEYGGFVTVAHDSIYPNSLLEIIAEACLPIGVGHGCFRGPPGLLDARQQGRAALIAGFEDRVQLGTCGSGQEQGLAAMLSALEQDGCLSEPFLRPNANLIVVFVTDEEDADNTQISLYLTDLAALKPLAQTRIAVIAGIVDGMPSKCSAHEGAACGSLCNTTPAAGSGTSCRPGVACPAGEYCDGATNQCENRALRYWNADNCGWCTYYNTPDCCEALATNRYVDFAHAFEQAVNRADPSIPVVGCDGSGDRPVCLLESICQDDLSGSMGRIARVLMLDAEL